MALVSMYSDSMFIASSDLWKGKHFLAALQLSGREAVSGTEKLLYLKHLGF